MLVQINKLTKLLQHKAFSSVATAAKVNKVPQTKLITCKRQQFDFYASQILKDKSKFGSIPLASSGWKSRRAKDDFFVIHPTVDEEEAFNRLADVTSLNPLIESTLLTNLQSELDIHKLTHIQENAIPKIVDSNHVIIAAETGCGKTLAYLVPIMHRVLEKKSRLPNRDLNTPLVLILTPGRELASQIACVAEKLAKGTDLKVKTILGGSTKQKMINPEFEDVDILIGTMGAISKLVTTGIYRMEQVRHVVLDEADTLLDDSFSDKLCYFLRRFPFHKNHLQDMSESIIGTQLVLASATMPQNIETLLQKVIDTETIHEIVSPNLHHLMPHVQQKFLRMNKSQRPAHMLNLVKSELKKNRPLIIFGNKSATSDFVSIFLNNSGIKCINLNGDMLMKIREGRFERFQSGEVDVLSTTDVGSRGLDTTRARHVINFDFPLHVADYIHRCGRIGRAGSNTQHKSLVTNFVSSQREVDVVQKIEFAARTGGLLPDVNANITNLIRKRMLKDLKEAGVDDSVF